MFLKRKSTIESVVKAKTHYVLVVRCATESILLRGRVFHVDGMYVSHFLCLYLKIKRCTVNVNCLLASLNARIPLRERVSVGLREKPSFGSLGSSSASDGEGESPRGSVSLLFFSLPSL